jgi:phosphonate transport system permease protein
VSVAQSPGVRRWKRPPRIKSARLRWAIGIGAAIYISLAIGSIEVNWLRVYEGLDRGWAFVIAFTEPDFVKRWRDISHGLIESLTMTVTSTVLGILPVYLVCRGVIAISRTFQEIIIAIFFVAMFGFGPLAGMLTLSLATIGFLAKLLAEDIEDIDPGQAEAVRATGAGWLQWINYGIQAPAASAPHSTPPSIAMSSTPPRRSSSSSSPSSCSPSTAPV